jgi:hypothetical protein
MSFNNPAIWLLAALAVPCAFLAVRYWQRALFGVFVLLVFEGALRKWALPAAQAQIYLVKDVILLAVYLGFILDGQRHQPALRDTGLIKIVLILGFVFGCIEVLNPNSPSILVGVVGLKTYFLYAPIAFILPYAFKSREHFFNLIRRYIIMAIPVAVLGFVQIAAGPASSLNTYLSYDDESGTAGVRFGIAEDLVRTSGTFSYISGYTSFLIFVSFLAIGYNMARGWRLKSNISPMLALVLVVGAMFTTGSRGPVFTLIATGPIILLLAASNGLLSYRTAIRLGVLIPVLAIAALSISPRATEAFMQRASGTDSSYTLMRVFSPLDQTIGVLSYGPVLGFGIGTTHNAAFTIMGTTDQWWLHGLLVEDEMARVTEELGVIGLLLNYFLRFLIAAFALRCAMTFKDPGYRALGIVLAVHLMLGIAFQVIFNPTAGLYYWGALGLVLTMRRLEQSVAMKSVRALTASRTRIGLSTVGSSRTQ